jgi:glycosyltransferase involved in cell wall biosynthesis
MSVLISVVVCTYNRACLLRQCLQSLADQTLDKHIFEVIVVDSNSTDETSGIIRSFLLSEPNFKAVSETRMGLSRARNRGCLTAQGQYVAYTDDDCKLPPEWLETARSIIGEPAPEIFGGPILPFYDSPKPAWYKDEYASVVLSNVPRMLSSNEYLIGANMFYKKSLLGQTRGFDPRFGMAGDKIAYGEETHLQITMRNMNPGIGIFYDPRLSVFHLARKERMTIRNIFFHKYSAGRDNGIVFFKRDAVPKKNIFLSIGYDLIRVPLLSLYYLFGSLARNKEKYPYYENYLVERFGRVPTLIGYLSGEIHLVFEKSSRSG